MGRKLEKLFRQSRVDELSEKYASLYFVAQSANDGSEFIGVSLLTDNAGAIFYFGIQSSCFPVGMPKIANSFTEWMERTLDAGPNASCPYWEMPDFEDLGPAIPGDPYYQAFGTG